MDHEAFEREYLALLEKYDVSQTVLLYRDGAKICVRGTGNSSADDAGATVLAALVENMLRMPSVQNAVIAAMIAFHKDTPT